MFSGRNVKIAGLVKDKLVGILIIGITWNFRAQYFGARYYFIFRHICKIVRSDYELRHVWLSICMEQLGSHKTDFDGI
jgi:hypothetical protein